MKEAIITFGFFAVIILIIASIFMAPIQIKGMIYCSKYCEESFSFMEYWSDFPFIYSHYKCEEHQVRKYNNDICPDEDGFYKPCKTYSCNKLR